MNEVRLTRKELLENLQHAVCSITFEKVDGTIRKMHGTLLPEWIPDYKEGDPEKVNYDVIRLYDIDKQGWRSFRVNNVIAIHPHDPDNL